jgi:hypothetical protein
MTRITVIVDSAHHALGGSVVTHFESDHEGSTPLQCGPFDSPAELLQRGLDRLDKQLSLEYDLR